MSELDEIRMGVVRVANRLAAERDRFLDHHALPMRSIDDRFGVDSNGRRSVRRYALAEQPSSSVANSSHFVKLDDDVDA